jgi:Flp pilus assembly protein TadD
MAKSGTQQSGPIPPGPVLPGLGAPERPSSVPLPLPHSDLETFLARGAGAKPEVRSRPRPLGTSAAQEREAQRFAADGVRLMGRGRHVEAVAALRRSISLNPAVAEAQRNLGAALIVAGRPDQAVGPLTTAIRLDPGFAMAHVSLGFVFETLGYLEKAIARYRDAVTLEPGLFGAHLGLGGLYQASGFRVEAAAAFRAAAAVAPSAVAARNAEVRALEALGQFDEALTAARAIVEAHPKDAQAHAILGKLLGQAGQSAEAAAHYFRAARLSPEMSVAWQGLARNKTFTADDAPLLARMNAALALPNQSAIGRQTIHFVLGKAYDDVGNYQEAMRNFEAGNQFRALVGTGAFTVEATFDLTTEALAAVSMTISVVHMGMYSPGELELYDVTTSSVVMTATPAFAKSAWTASFMESLAPGDYEVLVSGTSNTKALGVGGSVITSTVPEPATWAMMALGFAGLGYAAFRQRKTKISMLAA